MANIFNTVLTEVANVAIEINVGKAELEAGQDVSLPAVQVGTIGGKPLYLEAKLSTVAPTPAA